MKRKIVRASLDDTEAVVAIIKDASEWLATQGTDQWQYPPNVDRIRQSIVDGALYLILEEPGNIPIGTITIGERADPDFWGEDDDAASALYLNRMAVLRSYSGQDIGTEMLQWAKQQARLRGKKWLRLDAWRTNQELQDYYRRQGFELVRIVEKPWRKSGALFQQNIR